MRNPDIYNIPLIRTDVSEVWSVEESGEEVRNLIPFKVDSVVNTVNIKEETYSILGGRDAITHIRMLTGW